MIVNASRLNRLDEKTQKQRSLDGLIGRVQFNISNMFDLFDAIKDTTEIVDPDFPMVKALHSLLEWQQDMRQWAVKHDVDSIRRALEYHDGAVAVQWAIPKIREDAKPDSRERRDLLHALEYLERMNDGIIADLKDAFELDASELC